MYKKASEFFKGTAKASIAKFAVFLFGWRASQHDPDKVFRLTRTFSSHKLAKAAFDEYVRRGIYKYVALVREGSVIETQGDERAVEKWRQQRRKRCENDEPFKLLN